MTLLKVKLVNFRNYKNLSLKLSNYINIFYGSNAQGKTSFLEAIYVALRGKSFKPFIKDDYIQFNKDQTAIYLELSEDGLSSDITTTITREQNKLKKDVKYCGKKSSFLFIKKKKNILIFIPEKLDVIKLSSNKRREFIDDLLKLLGLQKEVRDFENILNQKKHILFQLRQQPVNKNLIKTLESTQVLFLKYSLILREKRREFLKNSFQNLDQISAEIMESLGEISLDYKNAPDVSLDKEIQALRCLSGPHLDDIRFLSKKRDSRLFCSQGQQRALILCLLLSQIQSLKEPLLLLDDVFSELDQKTQENLLFFIEKTKLQVLITTSKKLPIKAKKSLLFYVKNGKIDFFTGG